MVNISEFHFPKDLYPIDFDSIKSSTIREWAILAFEESYKLTYLITIQDEQLIKKTSLSAILLYLSLRIAPKFDLHINKNVQFIDDIRAELAPVIGPDLQLEILDNYTSVEEFVKERLIDFIDEYKDLYENFSDFEMEDCNSKFNRLSFLVLGEPLRKIDYEGSYEDREHFNEYMTDKYDDFAEMCNESVRSKLQPKSIVQPIEYLDNYLKKYKEEYGEIKFNEIKRKIYSSNHVLEYLSLSLTQAPKEHQIVSIVLSTPYFMFARKTTVAIGCVFFLEYWQISCNSQFQTINETEFELLFDKLLKKALKLF